jgi:hypothetical protein
MIGLGDEVGGTAPFEDICNCASSAQFYAGLYTKVVHDVAQVEYGSRDIRGLGERRAWHEVR